MREWIKATIAATLLATVLAAVVVGASVWAFLRPPPPDAQLVARFQKHRVDFQALADQVRADADFRSAFRDPFLMHCTITVRDSLRGYRMLGAGEARSSGRAEYCVLLARAGLQGIWRSADGAVWCRVMNNYDIRKGLVFSARPLTPERPSLDGLEREVGSGYLAAAYRPVEPGWYLFLEARE